MIRLVRNVTIFSQNIRPIFSLKNFQTNFQTFKLTNTNTQKVRFFVSLQTMDKFVTKKPRDKEGDGAPSRKMTRETAAKNERERYLNLPLSEKRKTYKCGQKFVTADDVQTWAEYANTRKDKLQERAKKELKGKRPLFEINTDLNNKVSIWRGDVTTLEIDSIANAANNSLLGGGGVDGAIHRAAGSSLKAECATLGGCDTGLAKITGGYKLPAKYVIHTVGPIGEQKGKLRDCYVNCLNLMKENGLKHIAFPCISTGIYGYPNERAVHVALDNTRKWLETDDNAEGVERIIFCLFLPVDVALYEAYMQLYFPVAENNVVTELAQEAKEDGEEVQDEEMKSDTESSPAKEKPETESDSADKASEEEAKPTESEEKSEKVETTEVEVKDEAKSEEVKTEDEEKKEEVKEEEKEEKKSDT